MKHFDDSAMMKNNDILKIGISGGTFDPIHLGHLMVAENIRKKFCLNKVVFIPSGNPPHKNLSKVTDAELRFSMVQKAIDTNPYFEASRIEIDREGYTYTVDTLRQLHTMSGGKAKFYFIIGADVVLDLMNWRNYKKVFTLCEFIATLRPGYRNDIFENEIKVLSERHGAVIHTVEAPLIDISSTIVRESVRAGKSIKDLVTEDVERFIVEKELYKYIAH